MPHILGGNWLNENQFRDYPLIRHNAPRAIPTGLIADFGAILPFPVRDVWLYQITRAGSTITFEFKCTSSEAILSFTRAMTAVEHTTTWATAGETEECDPRPEWFGFLTTGQMSTVDEILPGDGVVTLTDTDWLVEPVAVQRVDAGGIESINLANYDRTYTDVAPGCDLVETPLSGQLIIDSRCIVGDVEFVEGFNCLIRQSPADSRLTFMAQRGEGDGVPCAEIPLGGQTSLSLSPYLSGGPRCEDLLRTINGVAGPHVRVTGSKGVDIYQHASDPNILVIDLTGRSAVNCVAALEAPSSSSSSSMSSSSSSSL